jgi:tetrapyrrole methylase family protein/MazG family protein
LSSALGAATPDRARLPRVTVVGLGPAGPELVPGAAIDALRGATRCLLRTARHPSAAVVDDVATGPVETLDRLYEGAATFDDVYGAIVEEVVAAASAVAAAGAPKDNDNGKADDSDTDDDDTGYVAYAVPGSPLVAERTVVLLRADPRVSVDVVIAPSFLDLAWERLAVDPVAVGVRIVDATAFATEAAGERGPLLVAQCHSRAVLGEVKLAADDATGQDPERSAVLLHHLGLPDERVVEVPWADIDRTLEADHLTALWVPRLAPPVGAELVGLEELVRTLRAQCPWDQRQTHGSLARHLLEEAYEALDAIEAVAATEPHSSAQELAHLEEELGDLLFQVYFHALLATEAGHFTLADVARTLHDKLVSRHPHVFGDAVAETPEDVAARWEVLKKAEKGRASVTEGIPRALPALALVAKLQRKAESLGLDMGTLEDRRRQIASGLEIFGPAGATGGTPDRPGPSVAEMSGETLDASARTVEALGEMLFAVADAARRLGVDPETALRSAAGAFRRRIEATETHRA